MSVLVKQLVDKNGNTIVPYPGYGTVLPDYAQKSAENLWTDGSSIMTTGITVSENGYLYVDVSAYSASAEVFISVRVNGADIEADYGGATDASGNRIAFIGTTIPVAKGDNVKIVKDGAGSQWGGRHTINFIPLRATTVPMSCKLEQRM